MESEKNSRDESYVAPKCPVQWQLVPEEKNKLKFLRSIPLQRSKVAEGRSARSRMKAITLIVLGILSIAAGDVQYNTTWFCALHSGDIDYNTTLATLVVQQAVQLGCT